MVPRSGPRRSTLALKKCAIYNNAKPPLKGRAPTSFCMRPVCSKTASLTTGCVQQAQGTARREYLSILVHYFLFCVSCVFALLRVTCMFFRHIWWNPCGKLCLTPRVISHCHWHTTGASYTQLAASPTLLWELGFVCMYVCMYVCVSASVWWSFMRFH